jgi:hypothetical protein
VWRTSREVGNRPSIYRADTNDSYSNQKWQFPVFRQVDTAAIRNADPSADPEISVQTFANGIIARSYEGSEVFIQMLILANYKHNRFATSTVEPLRRRR